jgi:ketosteroid isomerase-like protein
MGRQEVQTLEGLYDAFNSRDIEGILAGMQPDVVIEETEDLAYAAMLLRVLGPRFVILSGRYEGHDEVRRLFESVWEIADWFGVQPNEYVEQGNHVVVPLVLRARSRTTGSEGEAATAHLWDMRDGKAERLRVYADREQALAVAAES